MQKFSLKYGALFGILSGTIMVIAFYSGVPTKGNRYLMMAVVTFMYLPSLFSIKEARKFNGGEIEFKNALKTGISAAFLMAFIFSIFTIVYYSILNPNFADKYLIDIEISLKAAGKTPELVKNEMIEWRNDMSALNQTSKTFFGVNVLSAIFAAINALIFCKKD